MRHITRHKRQLLALSVVLAVVAGAASPTATHAAGGPGDNMDARSHAFVKQLHGCDTIVSLALQIVKAKPNDLVNASIYVNKAKSTCSAIRDRMATMNTKHFTKEALTAEVAVDYWVRGLGRFSNYIDSNTPSDIAKAAEYFTDARAAAAEALNGINRQRKVYGLKPLR